MQLRQEQKQDLRQEQWMKLQLVQFMKLLQLSSLELQDAVEQELEQNPVLEARETKENAVEDIEQKEIEAKPGSDEEVSPEEGMTAETADSKFEYTKALTGSTKGTAAVIEKVVSRHSSLRDYLMEQLVLKQAQSPADFTRSKICEFLICNIDERGYLRAGIKETADILQVEEALVEKALKNVQGLDPPGIGARDLKECLLLQIKTLRLEPAREELLRQVVEGHLDDMAVGRFNKIANALGRTEDEIREINALIKKLNPYPGQSYSSEEACKVIPEIFITKNRDKLEVAVDSKRIPRLHLNPLYLNMSREKRAETKDYLKKKIESAKIFMGALEKRQEMMRKISELAAHRQADFIEKGVSYLKPLTMEETAGIAGVHVSTVSRAIANKFVQSPRGIFPLKFLFSAPVTKGGQISSRSVKERIARLIEGEDTTNPLSDEQAALRLKSEGIDISRRAAAKYRAAMNISSTFKRRTTKKSL